MSVLVSLLALLAAPVQSGEGPPEVLLVLAAKLFEQSNYAGAADIYDRFAESGVANGKLFLNQGNAHFLAGNLPHAILAYRRADRWLPNDARLRANLQTARDRVLEPPADGPSLWASRLPRLSRPWMGRLVLIGYGLGWLSLLPWIGRRRRRWVVLPLAFWAFAGILWGCLFLAERRDAERPVAVVADDGVVLRQGNGESYPALQVHSIALRLNRGVEGRVRAVRPNGWAQVELADGVVGWLPRRQVLLDREPE